jgi:hypothetical protein
VEEAQEGVFDIRRCGAASGCKLIRDILEGRLSEAEFGGVVADAARRIGGAAPGQGKMHDAAISFWRTLARVDT